MKTLGETINIRCSANSTSHDPSPCPRRTGSIQKVWDVAHEGTGHTENEEARQAALVSREVDLMVRIQ